MLYQHLTETCFSDVIGPGGAERAEYEALLQQTGDALDGLEAARQDGSLPVLALPAERDDLEVLKPIADDLRKRFRTLVVLGTGGSSLGAQALAALADQGYGPPAGAPKVYFIDNLDPHGMQALLAGVDLEHAGFLTVSKSGTTAETLAQTLVCIAAVRQRLGERGPSERFLGIAEAGDNSLRRLSRRWGFNMLDHDPKIGGRFSVLSLVGLLPAMVLGLDAAAVRLGAAEVLDQALAADDLRDVPPAIGAAINVGLQRGRGVNTSVMMAYADRLERFALWYRQLWAESLGKDGKGTLPVRSLGPVDQHSQVQLYLDGPNDKFFTLILPSDAGRGPLIDVALSNNDSGLAYLRGRTIGDLAAAEGRATAETLANRGRPTRVIRVDVLDERTMGALFMHYMLETMVAARLLGVNAFDQPAVEDGKILTRKYLAEA